MKILLDENLPLDLRHFLAEHDCRTVSHMKWKGVKKGALLARAAAQGFDAIITRDAGMQYQQNRASLPLTVVLLPKKANALEDIIPIIPALLAALKTAAPRSVVQL